MTSIGWFGFYFLKEKKEEFPQVQSFQNLVETTNRDKITTLPMDNRGEFTSNEYLQQK